MMDIQHLAQKLIVFFEGIERPVHLHEPHLTGNELNYVTQCIQTGWVSSVGSFVDRFERELGDFCGGYAIPTVNGTAALHLSLILAGVERDQEVITPSLTFVATANAVHYCGAIPHFAEVAYNNFGIDAEKLDAYLTTILQDGINIKTGRTVSAIIVTHIFGHCADIDALCHVAQKHNLTLIEDAAESLGSFYKGRHTGLFGKVSALSFNGNKTLTTGGGGAVLTSDKELALRAKHLSTTAKKADPYMHTHDDIGYNYRMPNINAALGCAQLEKLPDYLLSKANLASQYEKLCDNSPNVKFVRQPENTISNHWLNSLILSSEDERNHLIDLLSREQIYCRGVWQIMPDLPMYKHHPSMDVSIARDLALRTINLPSSPALAIKISNR